jgi:hypothetical protein
MISEGISQYCVSPFRIIFWIFRFRISARQGAALTEFPYSPFSRIMRLQAKMGISCLLPCSSEFISYRCSVMQLCLHCAMNPARREQDSLYTCKEKWRYLRLKRNLQWKPNKAFCVSCCWVTCNSQLHKNIDCYTTKALMVNWYHTTQHNANYTCKFLKEIIFKLISSLFTRHT